MKSVHSKRRIVILGYIVRGPLGGLAWHHLQYVLGLHLMGHDVLFLEDSDNYNSCYNPDTNEMSANANYGLNFVKDLFSHYGLRNKWAYFDYHQSAWFGLTQSEVFDFCKSTDILLNISDVNPLRDYTLQIPIRVLIDTDPVFTQLRHLMNKDSQITAMQHTDFFSFGENFGKSFCTIPSDGLPWLPTRQPLILDAWKITEGNVHLPLTTIMQWDSYQVRHYEGIEYGMKSRSFDPYYSLPEYTHEKFELAIGSSTAPKETLIQKGWLVTDPLLISRTTVSYQQFIQQSKAEWSVAKHGYVISRSGWFSERSACYLASARPVLIQDTGFSQNLECGRGLLRFSSPEECIEGINEMNSRYKKHCQWATEIASSFFDSKKVLSSLLYRLS